ncbi:hypothetical protein C9926_01505 [Sulfurovum lithotrophicum]|nr:hypothetical protein C9926_01505 [Sulfurovum lithotrophicum]
MRAYFHLFFGLLVPLSGLFIVASIIYYNADYNFTKSLRIGVLSGFFIAIVVSFFTAILLLIMRAGKQPQKSILRKQNRHHSTALKNSKPQESSASVDSASPLHTTAIPSLDSTENKTVKQRIMLLMDRELAFEVAIHAISEQKIGTITENLTGFRHISVLNNNEVLHLEISPLTRHTSQVVIESQVNSKAAKKIITYIKEKEHSFLQY